MKTKKRHTHFLVFLLLLCMLKVAIPIGEFFHNHHSEKELCTYISGKKCLHDTHFSSSEKSHDCVFLQLHSAFLPSLFLYYFSESFITTPYSLEEGEPQISLVETSDRGPPFA